MHKFYSYLILFVLVPFFGITASNLWAAADKHVLVLHSYHKGLTWTDSITAGLKAKFDTSAIPIEIEYAFMDTKRIFNQAYIDQLVELYRVKYENRSFDAIIPSDDHAFKFLLRNHKTLFGDTPIIFCGVNYFKNEMLSQEPHITGVLESFDMLTTINTALDLHPQAKRLIAITDQTVSGQANKKRLKEIIAHMKSPNQYMFDYLQLERFGLKLTQLPAGSRIINRPKTFYSQYKDIFWSAVIIFSAMSTIILSLLMTIASMKKAGRALMASKNRFQNVFNSTPVALFEADFSAAKKEIGQRLLEGETDFRSYLDQHEALFHHLTRQLKIKNVNPAAVRLFEAPDRDTLINMLPQILADEATVLKEIFIAMADGRDHLVWETTMENWMEQTRYVILSLNLPKDPDSGSNMVACVFDITGRKMSEEALRRSEDRFKTVFNQTASGMALIDPDGILFMCNDVFAKIIGFRSSDEVISTRLSDYFKDREKMAQLLAQLKEDKRLEQIELDLVRKDGDNVQCLLNAIGRFNEQGDLVEIQGALMDMTRMKSLEAQLLHAQKMESIGTMAGGVAHDFNNLLMGIMGNTSLMLIEKDRGQSDYQRLKSIEQLTQSGSDLTRQLLGFAKGGKYEARPTDLNKLILRSIKIFARTHKEIQVHTELSGDLMLVEADHSQIDQVLYNLYLNAWQAMRSGGRLIVRTRNQLLDNATAAPYGLEAGDYVEISVQDNGMGIDTKIQQRIFDPFFTTKERECGTGLGLASAYGITQNHAGSISVRSNPGKGSCFTIFLPAYQNGQVDNVPEASPSLIEGNETILLVDDEEAVLDAVGSMLRNLGYTVHTAGNGKSAIEAFESNHQDIDMVILDMVMPEISGKEAFETFKQIDPLAKVLLCSGHSANGQAARIIERGCQGFLQKPFTLHELSQKVRQVFGS